MRRRVRLVFEIMGPPLVAAGLYQAGLHVVGGTTAADLPFSALVLLAYGFGALPSIAYAFALESCFARGLQVRSWTTIVVSTGLGLLSGLAVAFLMDRGTGREPGWYVMFPVLGLATGAITGALISVLSPKPAAGSLAT